MNIEEMIINNLNLELLKLELKSLVNEQKIIIKIIEVITKNGLYDTLLNSKNNILKFLSILLKELIKFDVFKTSYIESLIFNKNNNYLIFLVFINTLVLWNFILFFQN